MTWNQIAALLVYVALFLGSIAAMLDWQKRPRRTRLPFGGDLKLLRATGETQLRRVREFDEDAVRWMALAAVFPATVQSAGLAVTLVAFFNLLTSCPNPRKFPAAVCLAAQWRSGRKTRPRILSSLALAGGQRVPTIGSPRDEPFVAR